MKATSILKLAALCSTVHAVDKTKNPTLVASLKTDATQLDRQAHLAQDSDWLFDFTVQPSYTYTPGSVVNANAATFPATVGNGMTMAMLNLGPCAMLPAHFHPRATNFVVAIEGTTTTWMLEENGARVVKEVLTPGKMTIFPAASVHTMQNMGCGNATLVSALNSEDPGTHNLANALWNLPSDMVQAAFGQNPLFGNFTAAGSLIPPVGTGSVLGSADCMAKCNMKAP